MEEERSPKSEISFEKLAETSPVAITKVDKGGGIVYANDRAEEVFGLEKSEITDRTYDDPDWKITDFEGNTFPSEKLPFQIVKRTEEPVDDVRYAIEWPDSERKLLSVNASPLFDEDDEFDGMVSVVEDITEQVRTRRSLEESKKRYQQLFTETNEGVALHELIYDEEGKPVDYRILEINSNFESILGLTEEEVEGRRATEYYGQEKAPYLSRLAKVAKTGEPLTFETYHEPLNKHFRISIFSPGEDKVATAFTDITERVRNEERKDYLNSVLRSIRNVNQLLVSEKEVDTLIENICDVLTETRGYHNVWIALLDESNQLITAAESGLGNDFKPMLKRLEEGNFPARTKKSLNTPGPIVTHDPPEDCEDCPLAADYKGRSSITARLEHAGNDYGIIAASIPSKFADEEQEHHLFDEVAGDIALGLHDIEVEEELRRSKERYQKYFDKTGDAIFILKMGGKDHGKILDVNSSAVEQTGYSREELIGMNMLEDLALEPPPDADLDEIDSSLSRGETVQFTEKKERKDGTEYWTEVVVTPLEHEGEQANLTINRDITERVEARKELKSSEAKFRAMAEQAHDGLFIFTGDKLEWLNERASEILGYSKKELYKKSIWSFIHPEDRDRVKEIHKKGIEGIEAPSTYEARLVRKDGEVRNCELAVTQIEYNGKQAFLGAARDVTERKKAEEELRESEKKYRTVFETTGTAMMIIEEDTTISLVNKEAEKLSGYSKEEIEGNIRWTKLVAEDEKLEEMKEYHNLRRRDPSAAPNRYEFKLVDKQGNEKVVLISIDVIPGTKKSIASLIDITERKKTEKKLEHRAEFEELLREVSTDFMEAKTDELDTAMDAGLAKVGEFLDVDRSYVFTFDWDQETMSNTNEWCAEGIEPQIDNLQNLPISDFPAWTDQLKKLESIQIRSVSQLPESWSAEREILEAQDIQSLVVVPVSHGQNLLGYAGFDLVKEERDWSCEDTYLLQILGDLAGHSIWGRRAEKDIRKSKQELEESFVELAETTSRVLGVRDPYTEAHEQRVAELAKEVGRRMGLDEEKLLGLYIGGVLHDIGKIAIPPTILTKPGELKDTEWKMIKSHPDVGYNQILEDTDFPWPVAEMTLHHQERLDGSGYPDGLEGDELTTEVRILGAVDVVEAMSTRRPYREARSKERTLNVIKEGKGEKFDPEVVDILVEMIEEGEIQFGEG